jgi:hypothetical protein
MVFEALCKAVSVHIPYEKLPPASKKQFDDRLPLLVTYLHQNFDGWDKKRNGQRAFLLTLMGLLAADLRDKYVTPTPSVMIQNLSRVPEVFENNFPDYISSGMTRLVTRKFW